MSGQSNISVDTVMAVVRADADKKRASNLRRRLWDSAEHRRMTDKRRRFTEAEEREIRAAGNRIVDAHDRGIRARGALFQMMHPAEATRVAERYRGVTLLEGWPQ